jgi:hypothetical protein
MYSLPIISLIVGALASTATARIPPNLAPEMHCGMFDQKPGHQPDDLSRTRERQYPGRDYARSEVSNSITICEMHTVPTRTMLK